jgi:hypothetical protein
MAQHPLSHANIIELLGIKALPLDGREEIVESATELVETRVVARVAAALAQGDAAEAQRVLDQDDEEALVALLAARGVDLSDIIAEEVERAKEELLITARTPEEAAGD